MSNPPSNSKMSQPVQPPYQPVDPAGDDVTDFTPSQTAEDETDYTPIPQSDDGATDFSLPATDDNATEFTPPPNTGPKPNFEFVSTSNPPPATAYSSSALPTNPRSPRRRFSSGELIARGVYRILHEIETAGREAIAYQGETVIDQTPVFIKQLVEARSTIQDRQKLAELRDRLISINNDFCLKCHELFLGDQVLEIFEFLPGAVDLRELVRTSPEAVLEDIDRIIWQLAQGVAYLHSMEIVHRDLKPSNIMVQYHKNDGLFIKIVDYGTISLVGDDGDHTTFAGSRHYAPPEALKRKFQSRTQDLKKYDWWSVGRIIQEILSGCTIGELIGKGLSVKNGQRFSGTDVHFEEIMLEEQMDHYQCRAGMVELTEAHLTEEILGRYRTLLRGLLTTDVETRWGFPEIIKWFQDQSPAEHYDAQVESHSALHFLYHGRSYTLGEVAQTLATHEHWANAQKFLFQGLNATRNEKSLLDFIRLDIGDKLLIRDLDEITSLPNPRKLPNRDLFPALEDYATGLALTRIAQSGDTELGLHLRGLPVSMQTISRWSRSKSNDEISRVAVLIHPPLIEFFLRFAPTFYNELILVIRDFDEVRKMESALDKNPLTTAQIAQIFGLLLTPPQELMPILLQIREKYRLSTVQSISAFLESSSPDSAASATPVLKAFLIFCAMKDPKRFLTHEHYYSRERVSINNEANALVTNCVWLNVASVLRYRTVLLSSLWFLIPGHSVLLFVYCVGLGSLLRGDPEILVAPFIALVACYVICLASIRAQIWSSIKGYVKNNIEGAWILSTARYGSIIVRVSEGPKGARLTLQQVREKYEALQKRLSTLPYLKKSPVKLPPLPEPHGVNALIGLLAILMMYSTLAPFAMTFSATLLQFFAAHKTNAELAIALPSLFAFGPLALAVISWVLAVVSGAYFYTKWKPLKI